LKSDYAAAHNNLGVTLQKLGRLEEAEASYIQAIALRSDFTEAHYNLGMRLRELRKYEEAINKGYPYPHSYIENFFPNEFYDIIQAHMLEKKDLFPISYSGLVQPGTMEERSIMQMPSKELDAVQVSKKTFWNSMSKLLNSIEIQTALLHKFQPLVDKRLGENLGGDTTFKSGVIFLQDKGGFSINPHADILENVVVLLIYLPKTDSYRKLGTSIYIPKDRSLRDKTGHHFQRDYFDIIQTAEYLPNTAICFLKTSTSFHGVEKLPNIDTPRNLIQVCIEHTPATMPL